MILNKTHNRHRKFLKRWKSLFSEQGKIQASIEYTKKLEVINNEYNQSFVQMQKTHEAQIKSLVRKEREYESLCDELRKEKETIVQIRDNVRMYESEGIQHSKNLHAMLQDEKVKKFMKLNHDSDALKYVSSKVEAEASKVI